MEKYLYFGTYDGDLIDNIELAKMIRIISGERVSAGDFKRLRDISKTCPGISVEIKYPSVERLILHGFKSKAVKIMHRSTPELSLSQCYQRVKELEEVMLHNGDRQS